MPQDLNSTRSPGPCFSVWVQLVMTTAADVWGWAGLGLALSGWASAGMARDSGSDQPPDQPGTRPLTTPW